MAARAVFFDFGGTLARGEELLHEPWRPWVRAARNLGIDLGEAEIRRVNAEADALYLGEIYRYHGRTEEFWKLRDMWAIDRLGVTSQRQELFDAVQAIFNDYSLIHVYPETVGVLREAKSRGHHLGVISNFNDTLLKVLRFHGLDAFFDSVTYSQAVGVPKPDPKIFETALSEAGIPADRSLHVGDSWECDYLGAIGCGMQAVWLNRGRDAPPSPCREIRDLTGLLPLI